jgi:hypothetical protein
MPTDTTEKGLEDLIVAAMTGATAPATPPGLSLRWCDNWNAEEVL